MLILIIVAIVLVYIWFNLPAAKGKRGEHLVESKLSSLPIDRYHALNNVILKTGHGTTQIDHIVVSVYGIFVIETKNYSGWITGSEYSEQWTQTFYRNKFHFYNPLKQNYGHVKVLQEKLALPKEVFIPMVVFSNKSDLRVKTESAVIYMSQVNSFIESFTEIKINPEDLNLLAGKILMGNLQSTKMEKEHVHNVKTEIQRKKVMDSANICPRCGGQLIVRQGKYGAFWGCSNYPKCRYTKNT